MRPLSYAPDCLRSCFRAYTRRVSNALHLDFELLERQAHGNAPQRRPAFCALEHLWSEINLNPVALRNRL